MNAVTSRQSVSRALFAAALCFSTLAWAAVGKIDVVEKANREPDGGAVSELQVGSAVELKDLITVEKGNLKLTLNDGSVMMLSEGSELYISEADFAGQERKAFSAKLVGGKVWTKVTKALAGSGAKFEVTTERAVAGVRGTIFRIDTAKLVQGVKPRQKPKTVVRVSEGLVDVSAKVKKPVAAAPVQKGERKQVPGPSQISAEQWEEKFVQLQANQQVTIGDELWKEASYEPAAKTDAFARFVEKNQ